MVRIATYVVAMCILLRLVQHVMLTAIGLVGLILSMRKGHGVKRVETGGKSTTVELFEIPATPTGNTTGCRRRIFRRSPIARYCRGRYRPRH